MNRMRLNLKVPFSEKDAAKKLGARWDAARKIWYVVNQDHLAPFAQWSPTPHDEADATLPIPQKAIQTVSSGKVYVGSEYVERPRVCECVPWETCEKCAAPAASA